jgi:hypothetical protein
VSKLLAEDSNARKSTEDHQAQPSICQFDDFPKLPYDDMGIQGIGSRGGKVDIRIGRCV